MKILITGASGFIGSSLVDGALKKGWEVWAGVRRTSSKAFLTNQTLNFIDLDYTDTSALSQQIKTHAARHGAWDYVIHNAGITKSNNNADYYRINYWYTVNFINALRQSGNEPSKFLYMSSLGAVGPGDAISGYPLTMSDIPKPISEYGRSKLLAEQFIQTLPDFPYVILRPTGVYGPRERDYFVMIKMIKAGFNLSAGLERQMLNFIYINDLAFVCFAALESPWKNKTWFVADGDVYTFKVFSNLIREVLQKKRVLSIRIPLPVVKVVSILSGAIGRFSGKPSLLNPDKFMVMKQRNWTCDASELEHDLNFKAEYNLRKGMEETIVWYKKNGWL